MLKPRTKETIWIVVGLAVLTAGLAFGLIQIERYMEASCGEPCKLMCICEERKP